MIAKGVALSLLVSGFALTLVGCHDRASASESGAAVAPSAIKAAEAPAVASAPALAARAEWIEPEFSLRLSCADKVVAGQPAHAKVMLSAKAPFHVNEEYPHKFRGAAGGGVTFASPVVTREGKPEPAGLELDVVFTSATKGAIVLQGEAAFSLCTAGRCLMERRQLSLPLVVAP